MDALFTSVLNMSITGSIVILAVLLARLLLRNAPKVFSYVLWAVVLFRLLCPVSFSAPVSVLPQSNAVEDTMTYMALVPSQTGRTWEPVFYHSGQAQPLPETASMEPLTTVWLLGTALTMTANGALLLRWRRRLRESVPLEGNVYLCDRISTPFVLGLLRPRIYLPSRLEQEELTCILLHERHHIRRLDHITRLLAFGAVCIHWFNPLVWLAWWLSERDTEMSCDEAVLGSLSTDVRAEYSYILLHLSTQRHFAIGRPLAFGEGDTKERVKNIMKYRKPTTFAVGFFLVLSITLTACLSANPETTIPETTVPQTSIPEETTAPPVNLHGVKHEILPLSEFVYPSAPDRQTQDGAELLYASEERIFFYCYDTHQLYGYDLRAQELFLSLWVKPKVLSGTNLPDRYTNPVQNLIYVSQDGTAIVIFDNPDGTCRRSLVFDLTANTCEIHPGYVAPFVPFSLPDDPPYRLCLAPAVEGMRYTPDRYETYYYLFRSNDVVYEGTGDLDAVLMNAIDVDTEAGVDMGLIYEYENTIIFCGTPGIFGYDLREERLTFAIDVKKLMGVEVSVQGTSRGVVVQASADGRYLQLWDMSYGNFGMDIINKTAIIDLQEWTYALDTTYQILNGFVGRSDEFWSHGVDGNRIRLGYVMPGSTLENTCYIRGERKWYCFR